MGLIVCRVENILQIRIRIRINACISRGYVATDLPLLKVATDEGTGVRAFLFSFIRADFLIIG